MSSSTDPGNKSSAEIEREVEATRARLTGTIEEMKERVSPGQMFEQALDYVRGSGGQEFVSNLGASVRDNPLPVVLIGAGLAWLMVSGGRDRTRDYEYGQRLLPAPRRTSSVYVGPHDWDDERPTGPSLGQRVGESASSLGRSASDTAASIRDTASGYASQAGEAMASARDTASELASQAGDALSSARDTVADAASRAGEAVSDALRSVKRGARDVASTVGDRASYLGDRASHLTDRGYATASDLGGNINRMMREQPLLAGGVGLIIGAALGAALPGSEAEDRLMGETRDQVASRVQNLAEQGYQQAKEVAGEHLSRVQDAAAETYGRVREGLENSGLSPQRGAEALGQVAREVREAVEQTARDVAGQARDAASGGDKPQA